MGKKPLPSRQTHGSDRINGKGSSLVGKGDGGMLEWVGLTESINNWGKSDRSSMYSESSDSAMAFWKWLIAEIFLLSTHIQTQT